MSWYGSHVNSNTEQTLVVLFGANSQVLVQDIHIHNILHHYTKTIKFTGHCHSWDCNIHFVADPIQAIMIQHVNTGQHVGNIIMHEW